MIEEAAGTRMYEEKKQKAFKTIEKNFSSSWKSEFSFN